MKKIRYSFEYIGLLIILTFAGILSAHTASNVGGWIGKTIGPHLAASRKARKNIQRAFTDKSNVEHQKILKGMWENLGRVIFEYPHLKKLGYQTEIVGLDILERYKDSPAIVFAAHLANWEMCPIACYLQSGFVTHSLYRAPNNPMVDRMLKKARDLDGALGTVPKSKSGTREMVKLLQSNGHIGALIDQKYNEGIEASFFDRPAMTSTAFIDLAKKYQCPLIPMQIERVERTQFKITISEPINTKDRDTSNILDECHEMLEEWITKNPEQWLWLHKRWKD